MVEKNIDIKINAEDNLKKAKANINNLQASLKKLKQTQINLKQRILDVKSLASSNIKVNDLNNKLKQTGINIQKVNLKLKEANKYANGFKESIQATEKATARLKSAKSALVGPFLSLLFAGMALRRVMESALKSIFEGYKKALPEASKFNVLTNKLSANWEFFKFQLADALANSTLFQNFIAFLVNILQNLQKLSPETKTFLVTTIAVLGVFGGLLSLVGQVGLALGGLSLPGLSKELKLAKDGVKGLQTATSKFSWGALAKPGIILLIIAAIILLIAAWVKFSKSSDYAKGKVQSLKDGLKLLVTQITGPIKKAFESFGIYFKDAGSVAVFFGAVMQDIFSAVVIIISTTIGIIRTLFNVMQIGLKTVLFPSIQIWGNIAKGIINAVIALREYNNESISDGLLKAQSAVQGLLDYSLDFKSDALDIEDTWSDVAKTVKKTSEGFSSPAEAVRQYNKELNATKTNDFFKDIGFDKSLGEKLSSSIPSDFNTSTQKTENNVTNNYSIITLDDAVAQGIFTQEEKEATETILGVTI